MFCFWLHPQKTATSLEWDNDRRLPRTRTWDGRNDWHPVQTAQEYDSVDERRGLGAEACRGTATEISASRGRPREALPLKRGGEGEARPVTADEAEGRHRWLSPRTECHGGMSPQTSNGEKEARPAVADKAPGTDAVIGAPSCQFQTYRCVSYGLKFTSYLMFRRY